MRAPGGPVTHARQLAGNFLRLVQTLSSLTAAELRGNAGQLRAPAVTLVAAIALFMVALTLLLVTVVLILAQYVGAVAACAIVALAAVVAAWALAMNALSRLAAVRLAPRRSLATLQAQIDRFAAKPPVIKDASHEPARHD